MEQTMAYINEDGMSCTHIKVS